jgi:hypothetical protein
MFERCSEWLRVFNYDVVQKLPAIVYPEAVDETMEDADRELEARATLLPLHTLQLPARA